MSGSGHRWELADPPSGPGRGREWPAGATERGPAAEPGTTTQHGTTGEHVSTAQADTADRGRIALTGRGAIAGMLLLFLVSLLVASWLQWGILAGASFVIGSVAAAWYTRPRDLLAVAVSPPLLFFCALVCVKALTAQGAAIISTVEGTALTLANVAPWLFAGVILYLIVAWVRGLPRCVTELRHGLRPDLPRPRSESPGTAVSHGGYRPGPRGSR
ncbi:MAG: DUF6542 domain-containing protein [Streptosporangiaceae bacterium]